MRRRQFITVLAGTAAAWSLAARAQRSTSPVIGYLNAASREANAHLAAAFQSSLAKAGYVEGQNVTTGVNFFISELTAKRLGLLRALLPFANRVGALVNPNSATTGGFVNDLTAAASSIRMQTEIFDARDSGEIETAFSLLHGKVDALAVAPDSMFVSQRAQIAALAIRYGIPVVYTVREYVEVGGLMSYGPSVPDMYRQLGLYTNRVLRGEKPSELPVLQPTKFDLVINLKTARALGITIPPNLLATADDVIE